MAALWLACGEDLSGGVRLNQKHDAHNFDQIASVHNILLSIDLTLETEAEVIAQERRQTGRQWQRQSDVSTSLDCDCNYS